MNEIDMTLRSQQGAHWPADVVVVASHPRSGTHLMIDLLRRQFPRCQPASGRIFAHKHLYWNLDELLSRPEAGFDGFASRASAARPVLKTHRRPDFFSPCQFTGKIVEGRENHARAIMQRASKIYVYRPALETLRSLYFMIHPGAEVPFADFIRERRGPWSRARWWAVHLSEWSRAGQTLVVCYDDVIGDAGGTVGRIAEFLAEAAEHRVPVLPARPSSAAIERLKRVLNLQRESTALMSYGAPKAAIEPSAADREFICREALEVDPLLPGLPDSMALE